MRWAIVMIFTDHVNCIWPEFNLSQLLNNTTYQHYQSEHTLLLLSDWSILYLVQLQTQSLGAPDVYEIITFHDSNNCFISRYMYLKVIKVLNYTFSSFLQWSISIFSPIYQTDYHYLPIHLRLLQPKISKMLKHQHKIDICRISETLTFYNNRIWHDILRKMTVTGPHKVAQKCEYSVCFRPILIFSFGNCGNVYCKLKFIFPHY